MLSVYLDEPLIDAIEADRGRGEPFAASVRRNLRRGLEISLEADRILGKAEAADIRSALERSKALVPVRRGGPIESPAKHFTKRIFAAKSRRALEEVEAEYRQYCREQHVIDLVRTKADSPDGFGFEPEAWTPETIEVYRDWCRRTGVDQYLHESIETSLWFQWKRVIQASDSTNPPVVWADLKAVNGRTGPAMTQRTRKREGQPWKDI